MRASTRLQILTQWLPGEPTPDPEVVDWNLWLGPAPWRPYNAKYVSGGWRGYWDFDSGARLLDWGAHTLDLCQWANQADDTMPIEYEPSEDQDHVPLRQRRQAGVRFPEGSLRQSRSALHHSTRHVPRAVRGRRGLGRNGRQRRDGGQARFAGRDDSRVHRAGPWDWTFPLTPATSSTA